MLAETKEEGFCKGDVAKHVLENATTCLRIVVNKECNLRCIWCFKEGVDYNRANPSLSVKTFKRIISNAKKVGVRKLAFTGGEPLLYNNLFDLVKYANSIGLLTYVTTNGTAFSALDLSKWKTLDKNEFHVTLNGAERGDFVSVCGEDYFDQVIRGINKLREHGIPHRFNSIISSEKDWPRISKIIDFVGDYSEGMRLIGTHSSTDIEHFPQKRVSKLVLEKGGRFISRSKDIARNFGYDQYDVNGTRVDVFSMVFGSGCKNCNKCGEGIRFTRVVYDGDVKPCFSKTLGKLSNDSSDAEIQQSISKSINYLSDSLKDVHYIDSQYC